ncbi:MAG: cupin domain-containing protein [Archaeoglobaceae archaeon]
MQIFDLKEMEAHPLEERDKNVFYEAEEFKMRIVELSAGEEIPSCEMESYVIFYVVEGSAQVGVNEERTELKEGQCLVTEPATMPMRTDNGVKIMAYRYRKQIKRKKGFMLQVSTANCSCSSL